MRKMLRRRELFLAVKAVLTVTLRKGQRDLPVFFDELNDAFEAHDAEEYGRAVSWPLKYPANKNIFL
jgi:hypothetical protein